MKRRENIVLIGMPGSGKSTVGVVLAKKLGRRFVDTDLVIQSRTGKLLHQLISELGPEGFWELENGINASVRARGSVISPGGSAVYGHEAMEHFAAGGRIVYLRLPLEAVAARLGNLEQRGVTLRPGQDLAGLYAERTPLYEKYAHYTVDCQGRDIQAVVEEIVRLLHINTGGGKA